MNNENDEKRLNINNLKRKHYRVKIVRKKANPLKFIISVISYAIFIFLLLIGGALLLYIGNNKLHEMKGEEVNPKYTAYVVLTGSMEPEIMTNDVVISEKVSASELKKGDIITFYSSDNRFQGIVVTHRIVDIGYDETTNKYTYQTKGDANNTVDMALAEEDNIIGKVVFRIPQLGRIQTLLASKGGWIIVILIPCLAVLSYDIMKLFKIIGKKTNIIKR